MILVTGYVNPDLDAVACAYAYSEFLARTGEKAIAAISGKPSSEAVFAMKHFKIEPLPDAEKMFDKCDKIVIVDASDLLGISKKIDPSKVTEVIDHRKVNDAEKFPNAKIQIDLVGSAATLVAEKFNNQKISRESAALLYSAIISNTINFKASVTTERDRRMALFLKKNAKLPAGFERSMFLHKSKIKNIKNAMMQEIAFFDFGKKIIAFQLEIADAEKFVERNRKKINLVMKKSGKDYDYVFLNCIDVLKGKNVIVSNDSQTSELLEKSIKIKFQNNIGKTKSTLMRKQIMPMIKEFLE